VRLLFHAAEFFGLTKLFAENGNKMPVATVN
jgi:hypothetical protein